MFNRKTPKKAPPRELTPWELAQQNSSTSRVEETVPKEDVRPPKKEPKSKKKKPESKGITNATLLKGIFIVCLAWSIYFISPLSKVSEIEVVGLSQVSAELVQEKDGIVKGQSIWTILANRTRTATLLKAASPKIKDASIELEQIVRKLEGTELVAWNKIRLNIEENPAIGYFKTEEKTFELLADGQTIEVEANLSTEEYPELVDFTEETQYKTLAKQLEKVSSSIIREIKEIQYPNDIKNHQKIYLKMKDGNRVIGNLKDIGDKLVYYPSIAKQLNGKKGTVDMEVGIYFTPDTTIR